MDENENALMDLVNSIPVTMENEDILDYYSEKFKDVIGISPLKFRKEFSNIDNVKNIDELKNKREYLINLKQYNEYLLSFSNTVDNKTKEKKLIKVA